MNLYTLYVGQGNCSVLVGDSEAIVIDTYFCESDENAEYMKGTLAQLLSGRKLIGLILTGFDCDHAHPKGVSIVVSKYRPHWVMYPGYFKRSEAADNVFAVIRAAESARQWSRTPLSTHSIRVDCHPRILSSSLSSEWDFETFSPHPQQMVSSNNSSLVVQIRPKPSKKGFRYLVTGDTENERWWAMNSIYGYTMQSDVMAAPHHGSENSMNPTTLAFIKPSQVLISAGINNQYNHPRKAVVDMYQTMGSSYFSTHGGDSWHTHIDAWGRLVTEKYLKQPLR